MKRWHSRTVVSPRSRRFCCRPPSSSEHSGDRLEKQVDVRVSETIAADQVNYYAYDGTNTDLDLQSLKKPTLPSIDELLAESTAVIEDDADEGDSEESTGGRRRRRRRRAPAANAAAIALSDELLKELDELDEEAENETEEAASEPAKSGRKKRRRSRGGRGRRGKSATVKSPIDAAARLYVLAKLGVTSKDIMAKIAEADKDVVADWAVKNHAHRDTGAGDTDRRVACPEERRLRRPTSPSPRAVKSRRGGGRRRTAAAVAVARVEVMRVVNPPARHLRNRLQSLTPSPRARKTTGGQEEAVATRQPRWRGRRGRKADDAATESASMTMPKPLMTMLPRRSESTWRSWSTKAVDRAGRIHRPEHGDGRGQPRSQRGVGGQAGQEASDALRWFPSWRIQGRDRCCTFGCLGVTEPRRVILLGSTGSIGTSTVEVLDHLAGQGVAFDVVGLAAGGNGELLAEQASRFGLNLRCVIRKPHPHWASVTVRTGPESARQLSQTSPGQGKPWPSSVPQDSRPSSRAFVEDATSHWRTRRRW